MAHEASEANIDSLLAMQGIKRSGSAMRGLMATIWPMLLGGGLGNAVGGWFYNKIRKKRLTLWEVFWPAELPDFKE